jgi:hypothetical protein
VTQAILPRWKTVGANLTPTVEEVVYTCPNNFTAKVDLVFVTNNTNGNKAITIKWYDHTNNVDYFVAPAYTISAYNFLKLSDGYLILNSGDKLKFTSETGSTMSAIVSVEEYFDPANANGSN